MPVRHQEGLQVLRYGNGQKYDAHWDYFFHKVSTCWLWRTAPWQHQVAAASS